MKIVIENLNIWYFCTHRWWQIHSDLNSQNDSVFQEFIQIMRQQGRGQCGHILKGCFYFWWRWRTANHWVQFTSCSWGRDFTICVLIIVNKKNEYIHVCGTVVLSTKRITEWYDDTVLVSSVRYIIHYWYIVIADCLQVLFTTRLIADNWSAWIVSNEKFYYNVDVSTRVITK